MVVHISRGHQARCIAVATLQVVIIIVVAVVVIVVCLSICFHEIDSNRPLWQNRLVDMCDTHPLKWSWPLVLTALRGGSAAIR